MNLSSSGTGARRKLPPLILHPFSDANGPERLSLSARASLILHGLLPGEGLAREELTRRLLDGRYQEICMLYYLGKDVMRWLEQCTEIVEHDERLRGGGFGQESFAILLIEDAPDSVREKLKSWGVVDYPAIFRRALGLHAIFADVPERESLSEFFLRHHHRFTDCLYRCRIETVCVTPAGRAEFDFELYASGEYARLLESQWDQS